ncbi:glycoside hydrolase family 3 protein [Couchioplanes caeruleus]|uniref:glycoside hydrolase family 3 N-terminal domain-containing protein n=1 Tax=Couchioplanes caeruleus TaxID=56438 RepID=UPI0020BEFF90|nr:glycoside hydrolase family 3 N-terminal domain-containing protein [Couchioplanes caeruleus]UQU66113.1 glycoside hydrolase family 3 protein [Couchioplanes caeruleus]
MPIEPGLRRLALRTLLAAFAGNSMPEWVATLLGEGLAGVTLFATNVGEPTELRRLTTGLRTVRPDALVAIDEEGGDVTRLAHRTGSPYPGNAALGAVDDPDLTRTVYAAIGADLARAGINLDLAPDVDVNAADDNPVIGTRSFGAHPALVARHAAAAVTGLQSTGVAACAKHFPGHGATTTDSHLALPTVDATRQILRERDLPPFAAAIAAGVRAVMTAHIRVPELTGTGPATFSRTALDLLRREYAFPGVIVTDALEMRGAVAAAGGIGAAAVLALGAGADLLCLGARVDRELVEHVVAEIVAAVRDGRLTAGRLEEAGARTADLAAWTRRPHRPAPPDTTVGYAAARRAIRVEGSVAGFADALIVQLESGHSIAEGRLPWGLAPHFDATERLSVAALLARAGTRPIVVVGRRIHRTETTRALIEDLAAVHPVAVVEMGWPSSWRPVGVRAFITSYGASHANSRAVAEVVGLTI